VSPTERRFQAFGVGTAKSGTHSLAALFEREYRSTHEPESPELIGLICDVRLGRRPQEDLVSYLRDKEDRLGLEMDSSSLNGETIVELVGLFPDAAYVLTLRDPYSWLDSLINHSIAHPTPPHWQPFRDLRFGTLAEAQHPPEETALAERGLHTLDGYLAHWARHNQRVFDAVPADRLLVVRTPEIGPRAPEIAAFVGVPADTLDAGRSHEFQAAAKYDVLDLIDRDHLDARVRHHCGPLLDQFP
jgi:hypothetical protein